MTLDKYKAPDSGVDFHGKHPRPPPKGNNLPLACFYSATLAWNPTAVDRWLNVG